MKWKNPVHLLLRSIFVLCLEWTENLLFSRNQNCLKVCLAVLACLNSLA